MTCAEAHEAILEADPGELSGNGEGALAIHLSGCSKCRQLARLVLDGEADLGRTLVEAVPSPNLDEILERGARRGAQRGTRRSPRRRFVWATVVPLASAATLVGIFFTREPQLPGPPYTPPPASVGLDVQAPEGQNVAVLKTNNPDITVLWLF
jgi:hypothetical protein